MCFAKRRKDRKKSNTGKKETGRRIRDLFNRRSSVDEAFFEELEELLVEADFGASAAVDLVDELREESKGSSSGWQRQEFTAALKKLLLPSLQSVDITPDPDKLTLYLVLGVNGVGKTTTIAKMAHRFMKNGTKSVVFAAADTFRAAAIDQLGIHAGRVGARLVKQEHGSDPGAVIYDAVTSAKSRGENLILADTAGRMHNRVNLVKELEKINRIAQERIGSDGVYKKLLVIDATTGQNGLRQAETFNDAVGIDAVILTKYDSSAKGGIVAAISRKLKLPFAFIGRGEGMDHLVPFNPEEYLDELLSAD